MSSALAGVTAILALAFVSDSVLQREVARRGNERVLDAAHRAEIVVREALDNRVQDVSVLSMSPEVIAASQAGNSRARELGIVGSNIDVLEKRFDADRSMQVAPSARIYLRSLLTPLAAAEMLLTDANGYNAVITERSSDFVQSDEAWWQMAWRDGVSIADAAYDSSANQTTVSLAAVVRDNERSVGVLKMAFSVKPLIGSLASAGAGVRVDVLDSVRRVLLSSDSLAIGQQVRALAPVFADTGTALEVTMGGSSREIAAGVPVNAGRWRVVAHLSREAIRSPYVSIRTALHVATGFLLLVLLGLLLAMDRFLHRRVSGPTNDLADVAEAVAGGDLTVNPMPSSADDEVGRLNRAVSAMILELRRLAHTIAGSADETRAMSKEISTSTEAMAASASEIANTAGSLSDQAASMAGAIGALAQTAASLRNVSTRLDTSARDGVLRNTALRSLASENRTGLDTSADSLALLGDDVTASMSAITTLGTASEEIRAFVTLVRGLARQSRLLALNAAMEAARAGDHGKGFAVVAAEVRRLASMTSDAAERTERVVRAVLADIDRSRESTERTLMTASEVRAAMSHGSTSFGEIERAVAENEELTTAIERASAETNALVNEMNSRLLEIAGGTETFAAAMQEVAASSEEQSASTEEIAAAANSLTTASARLAKASAAWITSPAA